MFRNNHQPINDKNILAVGTSVFEIEKSLLIMYDS